MASEISQRSPGRELTVRELNGAWNFRDVTDVIGDGLRPGRLFRSSELSGLDDRGREVLRALGITDIADLRSPREVERRGPGQLPDGVAVHRLPFPDLAAELDSESPHEQAFQRLMAEHPDDAPLADAAARYMVEEYRRFPRLKGAQRAVRQVIALLSAGRPVVTHCFAGKDRTGFAVAVVLEAAGVDREAIVSDYLRSNDAVPQLRDRILAMVDARTGSTLPPEAVTFAEARLTDAVLGVREDYLLAAREAIDDAFGSLAGYLRAADVSASELRALRDELLA